MKIQITLPDGEATGEIVDSAAGHELMALLPVTIEMYDLFEREKPGPLPRPLVTATDTMLNYSVGQIGYWADSHDIIFFTADDGKLEIPEPGIVHLGTVTSGLEIIADAGDAFTITIDKL